ncbi:MAG: hypothetical protein VYE15_07630 [Myxococcota bacterium]|nr:hypothetical protein [Myxococcota bacterium]
MSRAGRWLVIGSFLFMLAPTGDARAAVAVGARASGGTAAEWVAPYEAGNLMGLTVTLDVGHFQGGMSAGLVLPDSRRDGQFQAFGLEVQWHPFRDFDLTKRLLLSPYVLAGVGLTAGDPPEDAPNPPAVRWVGEAPQFLGQLGLGLTFGAPTGLYVSLDVRALNHTHGAVVMGAGFRI